MVNTMRPAVVLLSGGLDSATVLALAKEQGFGCHALTVTYGQRHAREIESARRVARSVGCLSHVCVHVPLDMFGGSALTDDIDVPKDESEADEIPVTYVPARNTVFLSLALALAETKQANDIFIGVSSVDYSGYPDCRPEFIEAFENLANVATKQGVEGGSTTVHAPLIRLSKADTIREGLRLGVDYSLTHSCYDPMPDGKPCSLCESCRLRAKGFADVGIDDPALDEARWLSD